MIQDYNSAVDRINVAANHGRPVNKPSDTLEVKGYMRDRNARSSRRHTQGIGIEAEDVDGNQQSSRNYK